MDVTDFNIYVIYDKPVQAMKKEVWQDFLEIACTGAEGQKDPVVIKNKILDAVWRWLDDPVNMDPYEPLEQHVGGRTQGSIEFNFSQFKIDRKGNCQDASSLYQVCCNACGMKMRVRYYEAVNTDVTTLPIFAFGQRHVASPWSFGVGENSGHMVGMYPGDCMKPAPVTDGDIIYEATFIKDRSHSKIGRTYSNYLGYYYIIGMRQYIEWHLPAEVTKVK